jgi:uncharacterized protein YutE (UPF0331/DUF86 family)
MANSTLTEKRLKMHTPPDDICLNKAAIIERSLRRIQEEFRMDPNLANFTHIDAMTLNIERGCQAAIDMAMHIVATKHLGMPQTSADAFRLLQKANLLTSDITKEMVSMTGFRNIAIHEYQELDLAILKYIAEKGCCSLVVFCSELGLKINSAAVE